MRFKRILLFALLLSVSVSVWFLLKKEPKDGEGYLEILHPTATVRQTRWYPRFTYTAGDHGILKGGGIKIVLPKAAADVPELPLARLIQDQFLTIRAPSPFKTSDRHTESGDWEISVVFDEATLAAWGKVVINFNHEIFPKSTGKHAVLAFSDGNGDGVFEPLPLSPVLRIHPAFYIHAPNLVQAGVPFQVTLSVDGGSLAQVYEGTVHLSASDPQAEFPASYTFKPQDAGRYSFFVTFYKEGAQFLTVEDTGALDLTFQRQIACLKDPPPYRLFFGDTHGHTSLSDGSGTPERYYEIARDVEHLDFCMLTDHDYHLSEKTWQLIGEIANRYDEPGKFVTMQAFEWSSKLGDKNCYFVEDHPPLHRRNDPESDHPLELFRAYQNTKSLIVPHHPMSAFRPTDWLFHDEKLQRLVEIYSLHGRSEFYANPNPITPKTPPDQKYTTPQSVINVLGRSAQDALTRGYRLGFIASGDKHDGKPGDLGLAAVYALELSRKRIFDALYDRRTYATTNARIVIDFRINGHLMGESFILQTPPEITASVIGTAPIRLLELLRDNDVILSKNGKDPFESFKITDNPPNGATHFYYLRVTQVDGEMAWSSPIWIDDPRPDLSVKSIKRHTLPAERFEVEIQNNGAQTSSNVSLTLSDRPKSLSPSVQMPVWQKDVNIAKIEPHTTKKIDIPHPAKRIPGEHEICVTLDPLNFLQEANESNNTACMRDLEAQNVILEAEPNVVMSGGETYTFQTDDETVLIEMTAMARYYGVFGLNPRLIDDDLSFLIDGVYFGTDWDFDQSDRYTWNGSHLLGSEKTIHLIRDFTKGSHELAFVADEHPVLKRIRIGGSGKSKYQELELEQTFSSVSSDDSFVVPHFTFEDTASIWREKIDDRFVVLYIAWSKNYPFTSNDDEEDRWYQGELRFVNSRYSLFPWNFSESNDHLVDDRQGSVSFVSKADKACGLTIVVEVSPLKPSGVILQLLNGGISRPEQTRLGKNLIADLTKNSTAPLFIPFNSERDSQKTHHQDVFFPFQAEGSVSMTEIQSDIRHIPQKLDRIVSEKIPKALQYEALEQVIAQKPDDIRLRNDLVRLYLKSGVLDRAQAHLSEAKARGIADDATFVLLGELAILQDQAKKVLSEIEAAMNLFPESLGLKRAQAKVQIAAGQPAQAKETLERLIEIEKNDPDTYLILGEALKELNETQAASHAYEQAMALSPYDYRIYIQIGLLQVHMQKPDEALSSYAAARKYGADDGMLLLREGEACVVKSDFECAKTAYQKAEAFPLQRIPAKLHLARLYRKQGDLDQGISILQEAIKEGSSDLSLLLTLGNFLVAKKDLNSAQTYYEQAVSLYPSHARAHEKLGRLYQKLKKMDLADEHLAIARSLGIEG